MGDNMKDTRAANNRKKKQDMKRKTNTTVNHNAKDNTQPSGNLGNTVSKKKETAKKIHGKSVKPQPESSWAEIEDSKENYMVKDLETLMSAPISEGAHFVFKAEQEWMENTEEFSEFFTLDFRKLSTAIECIPFHELHDIDEEYFTEDQLRLMQNNAAKAREIYEAMMAEDTLAQEENITKDGNHDKQQEHTSVKEEDETGIEDDLEFLLSLKEPVERNYVSTPVSDRESKPSKDTKTEIKKNSAANTADLEEWLDSVLDD